MTPFKFWVGVRKGFVLVLLIGVAAVAAPSWTFSSQSQAQTSTVKDPLLVRVAYSVELRRRPGWAEEFRCALSRAAGYLAPGLDRELKVKGRVPWIGGSQAVSVYDLRESLVSSVEPGDADLVVGLASAIGRETIDRLFEAQTEDEGLSSYTHGYVVLRVSTDNLCDAARLLAHELAHVFGAVHRTAPSYLLDQEGTGVDLDPLNLALMALHQDRAFGPGRAPLDGESLRTLWRLASARAEAARTWLIVGSLAALMGKPEAALRHYQGALDKDPTLTQALVNLGHATFQMGDLKRAEGYYQRALEQGPDDAVVHNNLAAIHYSRGEDHKAVQSLRRALALGYPVNPQFIEELEQATGETLREP